MHDERREQRLHDDDPGRADEHRQQHAAVGLRRRRDPTSGAGEHEHERERAEPQADRHGERCDARLAARQRAALLEVEADGVRRHVGEVVELRVAELRHGRDPLAQPVAELAAAVAELRRPRLGGARAGRELHGTGLELADPVGERRRAVGEPLRAGDGCAEARVELRGAVGELRGAAAERGPCGDDLGRRARQLRQRRGRLPEAGGELAADVLLAELAEAARELPGRRERRRVGRVGLEQLHELRGRARRGVDRLLQLADAACVGGAGEAGVELRDGLLDAARESVDTRGVLVDAVAERRAAVGDPVDAGRRGAEPVGEPVAAARELRRAVLRGAGAVGELVDAAGELAEPGRELRAARAEGIRAVGRCAELLGERAEAAVEARDEAARDEVAE